MALDIWQGDLCIATLYPFPRVQRSPSPGIQALDIEKEHRFLTGTLAICAPPRNGGDIANICLEQKETLNNHVKAREEENILYK